VGDAEGVAHTDNGRTPQRAGVPLPGRPVRGSSTGRPLPALLDLLGRRWTLRLLWELRLGPRGFRELRAACGEMSPTVLSTRLGELRAAGLVTADKDRRNALTERGRELGQVLLPLQEYAERWAEDLSK